MKRTHPGRLRTIVATNVRRFRMETGLSQQDFAYEIEMDRTYFGGIERGERNVSIDNIERIANGLKVQPFLLLVEADPDDKSEGPLPDR
ncbi:helix-turn-helix domain-containing protein [Sphingobium tyrosinilyticum]|uniref:Helix-turn-helix domain-containing protein n=1 Tax=Sphingobium tyrosinilyticum TaxID=2715436 RepID=A0ABV9F3J5_9SPHN